MTLPGVSWLCPTFARPPHWQHLLEERVHSFILQDYAGPRELLILNDCPEQELLCDVPGVRIVNLKDRLPNLGTKYNRMVELAQYDLLMPAEDDDLHLPWAISQAVTMLGKSSYWKPPQVWYCPKGQKPVWKHPVGVRHHASIFTREAWRKVGGYPAVTGSQDAAMDALLRKHCRVAPEVYLPPEEWAYIYRWGVSPCHLSGTRDMVGLWNAQQGEPGQYVLRPHWRDDYLDMTRAALVA